MSEKCQCSTCGYEWVRGFSGRHLCSDVKEQRNAVKQLLEQGVEVVGVVEGFRSIGNDRCEPDEAYLELQLPKEFIGQRVICHIRKA